MFHGPNLTTTETILQLLAVYESICARLEPNTVTYVGPEILFHYPGLVYLSSITRLILTSLKTAKHRNTFPFPITIEGVFILLICVFV